MSITSFNSSSWLGDGNGNGVVVSGMKYAIKGINYGVSYGMSYARARTPVITISPQTLIITMAIVLFVVSIFSNIFIRFTFTFTSALSRLAWRLGQRLILAARRRRATSALARLYLDVSREVTDLLIENQSDAAAAAAADAGGKKEEFIQDRVVDRLKAYAAQELKLRENVSRLHTRSTICTSSKKNIQTNIQMCVSTLDLDPSVVCSLIPVLTMASIIKLHMYACDFKNDRKVSFYIQDSCDESMWNLWHYICLDERERGMRWIELAEVFPMIARKLLYNIDNKQNDNDACLM